MPIYEYRCPDGHTFETFQSMSDDPVEACEVCAKPVERVFHPVAVHFKGSGFYTTDYAKKGAAKAAASDGGAKSETGGESKSDSGGTSESKSGSGDTSESKSERSGSGSGEKPGGSGSSD